MQPPVPAVFRCTGCEKDVHLDDALVIHSDGRRCLCLRCFSRHARAPLGPLSPATLTQIDEAASDRTPDYDWPVW